MRCCPEPPICETEYDAGSHGRKTYLVCKKHMTLIPWNKNIISQKPITKQTDEDRGCKNC